jgi:CBS domain containing-hemolysin-like protein
MIEALIIIGTLLLSAYFSGMEIAFVSSNKLMVEMERKQGTMRARVLSKLLHSPSRFIATMLVGNNLALVIYGIFMAAVLEPLVQLYFVNELTFLLIQTILSTLLILIVAEFLPKSLFSHRANEALNTFTWPTWVFFYLMYPISSLVMGFSNGILRLFFGVKPDEQPTVFKRVDLDHFLRERTEDNTDLDQVDTEVQYLQNALDFDKVKVRDCLIPRTEIVALDVSDEVEALRDKFYETGLGKILIYRGSIDEIIGYVHSFELFKKPKSIRNILLPVPIVPETMPARELLNMLLSEHKSLAVVVDEFGGTAGLVTVEDVIEEIFGDIEDEHDSEERVEEILAEDKYRFSARLEIDYINTTYKLDLPEGDDYETLGGLVVKVHESIPEVGERIVYEHFTFTIVRSTSRRIEEVILKVHRDD